jgi:hypothetical protein
MVVSKRHFLIVLAMLLVSLSIYAQQISVSSSVQENVISLSGQLKLDLKITSDKKLQLPAPSAPVIGSFIYRNVLSSSSYQTSWINGQISNSSTLTYTYIYTPQQTGKFTIPGFTVRIANRDYSTPTLKVEVVRSSAPQAPQYNQNPFYNPYSGSYYDNSRANGESMLLCLPKSQNVYLGEPVEVAYYVYTNQMVESFYLRSEKDSEGYGKSVLDQPTSLKYEKVTYDGRSFERALIKRIALYPQKTGRLQIPQITGSAQFTGIYTFMNKDLVSPAVWINVQPLPSGKPEGFSGAVGIFSISQDVSSSKINLGEALDLTLKITGRGNFSQFTAPALGSISGLQMSDPATQDKLSSPIEGTRYVFYTILPQTQGEFRLPGIKFSWFDPQSASYRTFSGTQQILSVRPANVLSYFSNLFQGDKPKMLSPLLMVSRYPAYINYSRQIWFWLLLLIMAASLAVSAFYAYERKLRTLNPAEYEQKTAHRILSTYLKKATEAAGELSKEFYPLSESGLINFLSRKYGISKGYSTSELLSTLRLQQIPHDLVEKVEEFLTVCQRARFMPGGSEAESISIALDQLRSLVQEFSKQKKIKHYLEKYSRNHKLKAEENGSQDEAGK